MTQQFIVMGKQLALYFKNNPFGAKIPFDTKLFKEEIDRIDQSIKDETKKDLLEFTDDLLKDKDGVEKAALFDRADGSIRVNRKIWKDYNDEERLVLVIMETSGLRRASNRYETAKALVEKRVALIVSIPLNEIEDRKVEGHANTSTNYGMRIVGQDQKQFEHITDNDVVIDGGVLGKGNETDQRVSRFLSNPSADKEWYELVQKAWAQQRPAYLVLTGPNGSIAFVSAIFFGQYKTEDDVIKAGVGAYSFVFTKYRQVYTGPCVGEALDLKARERLQNCFMNPQHYYAQDMMSSAAVPEVEAPEILSAALSNTLQDFKLSFQFLLSNNMEILEEAVRENYIYNYAGIILGTYNNIRFILKSSLLANGYEASLVGPFSSTSFWIKTKKKNLSSIRMFSALQTLAENNLGFIEKGMHCSIESTGEKVSGPALVELKKVKAFQRIGKCSGMYFGGPAAIENQLYDTMVKSGFYYNYRSQQWLSTSN